MRVGVPQALIGLTIVLTTQTVMAEPAPSTASADPRVQVVVFATDQVVTLHAAIGYALVVEFSSDEHIDSVIIGNSSVWQATANQRGDRLILKPLAGAVPTNMIVTTDTRRYIFTLESSSAAEAAPYLVRFDYSAMGKMGVERPTAHFKLTGARDLFPIEMSDDGLRTRIRWGADTPLPAVLAIEERGQEAIVNGRMVDGEYVIERIAQRFLFSRDKARAMASRRPVKARGS